ncbi:MAG: LLM class flavin-dependent oxidoreductase [Proteobacteria bacterium]|nr:LLM class flavin-dependent oxidoreductase [Pseudomonadota bacterium]
MKFGLMFFASSEDAVVGDKYRLIVESAKFGDRQGFSSIWVPERHFTKFGCLYPNPAVLQAALAMTTERIRLCAGSVVVPLHHPIRIVEEWSMVDNLSRGRVAISFASGWNPSDFAFFPENYQKRHSQMKIGIAAILRAWRGEALPIVDGEGSHGQVKIYPTPVQKKLPFWLTAAGNPETFRYAGEIGGNLLTHLLDQESDQLAEKIALYRRARAEAGHDPDTGQVSVMLHTLVGNHTADVRERARQPFCNYIKSNIGLLKGLARSRGESLDVGAMSEADLDEFVNFLYDRFALSRGLIGTPADCLPLVRMLRNIGVDEIACLLDFGPPDDVILQNLPHLARLEQLCAAEFAPISAPVSTSPAAVLGPDRQRFCPDDVKERCREEISGEQFRSQLASHGVSLHRGFAGVERVWRGRGESLGLVGLPEHLLASADSYSIHPALLDACSQLFAATLPDDSADAETSLYVPAAIAQFHVYAPLDTQVWSHAVLQTTDPTAGAAFSGDLHIYGKDGQHKADVLGLRLHRIDATPRRTACDPDTLFYTATWQLLENQCPDTQSSDRQRDSDPLLAPDQPSQPAESEAKPDNTADIAQPPGVWLIFADHKGVARRLSSHLEALGQRSVSVYPTDTEPSLSLRSPRICPHSSEQMRRLIDLFLAAHTDCRGIVHLWSLDTALACQTTADTLRRDQELSVASTLHLAQALTDRITDRRGTCEHSPRLWLITRDACAVRSGGPSRDSLDGLVQSPLWGLGRALAVEQPALRTTLIDLDRSATADDTAGQLRDLIVTAGDESMLALRAGQCHVARLERSVPPSGRPVAIRSDATYLITGGAGGLGFKLATWLTERGARNIVLLGRTPPIATDQRIAELAASGCQIRFERADVSLWQEINAAFSRIVRTMPPIKGIFHLAGVLDDDLIVRQEWQRFVRTRAAKVEGSWHLHRLSADLPLDYFVMFSSAASLVTVPGQASYAAANQFMDALAHYRRQLGVPALTVNWGPWQSIGHAATEYGRKAHRALADIGVGHLSPQLGLDLLDRAMRSGQAQVGVISVDWHRLTRMAPATITTWPFLRRWTRPTDRDHDSALPSTSPFTDELRALPAADRRQRLFHFLASRIAEVMKLPDGQLPSARQRLFAMGMDSIMALELKSRLEVDLARSLNATLIFRYPTVEALVEYLADVLPVSFASSGVTDQQIDQGPAEKEFDALSDDEMVQLLNREIESM